MSLALDRIRQNQRIRKAKRQVLQDVQRVPGILSNAQGLVQGVSLNGNGNRAYVAIGGAIDANSNRGLNRVVNAWGAQNAGEGQPGTPVMVEYNRESERWYIVSIDAVTMYTSGASVQYYNPVGLSGHVTWAEDILNFKSRPTITAGTTTKVEVKPGILFANGLRHEYTGEQDDLASYAPSSGNHLIAQLFYNQGVNNIEVKTSTAQSIDTAFDSSDWQEAALGADEWLPLQAYKLDVNSATNITQENLLVDNRPIYTLPTPIGTYANPLKTSTTLVSGREIITRGVQTENSSVVRTTLGVWWDL